MLKNNKLILQSGHKDTKLSFYREIATPQVQPIKFNPFAGQFVLIVSLFSAELKSLTVHRKVSFNNKLYLYILFIICETVVCI